MSGQVRPRRGQDMTGEVRTSQVRSGRVRIRSCQVKVRSRSGQLKAMSGQVMVRSGPARSEQIRLGRIR